MPRDAHGTTIATIGDLIDEGYVMSAWCPEHGHRSVDLQALAARYGRDASYIRGKSPIRISCALCGAKSLRITIRPK